MRRFGKRHYTCAPPAEDVDRMAQAEALEEEAVAGRDSRDAIFTEAEMHKGENHIYDLVFATLGSRGHGPSHA